MNIISTYDAKTESVPEAERKKSHSFAFFLLLTWVHMLWETFPFLQAASPDLRILRESLFHLAVWSSYSAVYLVPAGIVIFALGKFFPGRAYFTAVPAIVLTSAVLVLIRTDRIIFDLYRFHFNSFVLNLIFTPGGVQSLGTEASGYAGAVLLGLRILLIQTALFVISRNLSLHIRIPSFFWRAALCLFVLAAAGERVIYGISDIQNCGTVLDTARVWPLYKRTTFKSLAKKLGFTPEPRQNFSAAKNSDRMQYPLQTVRFVQPKNPPNIVWVVVESLRADRVCPKIMPRTWAFAKQNQHFTRHYSSGNGTREGMFGMFYGLSGSDWSSFLYAERGPLLMDRIKALDYQMDLRTSARFSYPEFDKTLFAEIPKQFLHEDEFAGESWQRDEKNTSAIIDFIHNRKHARPFMSFMFYESTHAPYTFPESAKIAGPVLEHVDYTRMSRENLAQYADQLLNRYTNAAHWIDRQIGRILDCLEQEGLSDNTIVIVTGDHGEEFMENGFWGHNSGFSEQQIRTPLVIRMPGKNPMTVDRSTSHMDIAVTLMQTLGAVNDPAEYALGRCLFMPAPRDYILTSDWISIGILTPEFKYRIPYDNQGMNHYHPTNANDAPYPKEKGKEMIGIYQHLIIAAIRDFSRFTR